MGRYHHALTEELPPQPGLWLYALTKAAGHEITRLFARSYPSLHVLRFLVSNFVEEEPAPPTAGSQGPLRPMSTTYADAGQALRCGVEVRGEGGQLAGLMSISTRTRTCRRVRVRVRVRVAGAAAAAGIAV
eukprot:SAG25_NODE_1236_length_3529_cov_1.455394_3_plen_131_part_00